VILHSGLQLYCREDGACFDVRVGEGIVIHAPLNRWRVGEKAIEKMEAFHEAGWQSNEGFALFPSGELRLKARPSRSGAV
jgi:hypothetical protein